MKGQKLEHHFVSPPSHPKSMYRLMMGFCGEHDFKTATIMPYSDRGISQCLYTQITQQITPSVYSTYYTVFYNTQTPPLLDNLTMRHYDFTLDESNQIENFHCI